LPQARQLLDASAMIAASASMTGRPDGIQDWLRLIQAEYLEMPGLHLTKPQIQRLWRLDTWECDTLLDALVGARFLRRTPRGGYVLNRD
jgi:hypothetical protein